jgi:hypothetical protein
MLMSKGVSWMFRCFVLCNRRERSSIGLDDFLELISASFSSAISRHSLWLDSCFYFVTEHDEFSVVMPPELCAQTVMPSSFVMWDGQQPGEG